MTEHLARAHSKHLLLKHRHTVQQIRTPNVEQVTIRGFDFTNRDAKPNRVGATKCQACIASGEKTGLSVASFRAGNSIADIRLTNAKLIRAIVLCSPCIRTSSSGAWFEWRYPVSHRLASSIARLLQDTVVKRTGGRVSCDARHI